MMRALVVAAGLYGAFLLAGLLAAPVLGLPDRAAQDFGGNARFMLQPMYGMSGEEIFAQVPAERMKQRVILTVSNGVMRAITEEEMRQEMEELHEGKATTPRGHVITTPTRSASWQGQVTTKVAGVQHAFALNFAVRDHVVAAQAPESCEPIAFHHWALSLLGVAPNQVIYCRATDTNVQARAVISIYAVDGLLLTPMYTQLTCSLIHDELSLRLGAAVDGQEHICFGFREDTLPMLPQTNPVSVRHHIFKST